MFWIRSGAIVVAVWLTGTVAPVVRTLPWTAGLAVEEVLADERLRAAFAEGVAAQGVEPLLVEVDLDARVVVAAVELERLGSCPRGRRRA